MFNSAVPYGYGLNPTLANAIEEGLVPVALTSQFLSDLCSTGFLWLPGVKYSHNNAKGDIDVVAICDQQVLFCECKDLRAVSQSDNIWMEEIQPQVAELISTAMHCKADAVVFGTMAKTIPETFIHSLRDLAGESLKVVFLSGGELEAGQRKRNGNKTYSVMQLLDQDAVTGQ